MAGAESLRPGARGVADTLSYPPACHSYFISKTQESVLSKRRRHTLSRPIKMVMASCGDANAAWVLSTNTETLCYELADVFSDLYDGYTRNGKVQDHGLVSKNLARISLAHDAPAGTLDKIGMEMNRAGRALFTKKTKLDSDNTKRHLKHQQATRDPRCRMHLPERHLRPWSSEVRPP
jgi:hypothetical protein